MNRRQNTAQFCESLIMPIAARCIARLVSQGEMPIAQAASLAQMMAGIEQSLAAGMQIPAVEIAGPGDPLADIQGTVAAVKAVRRQLPEASISLRTIGIGGGIYAQPLKSAGADRIRLEVNAVDSRLLETIYRWVRPARKTIRLPEACELLVDEQKKAITAFHEQKLEVDVVCKLIPGVNDGHVVTVAQKMADFGVTSMQIEPPEQMDEMSEDDISSWVGRICEECRSFIDIDVTPASRLESLAGPNLPGPIWKMSPDRPNVAVTSNNGFDINLHLGQAKQFLIYGPRIDGLICLLESRKAPTGGSGTERWLQVAKILSDCFLLAVSGVGENPRNVLQEQGLHIHVCEDNVEGFVDAAYGGGKKNKGHKARLH